MFGADFKKAIISSILMVGAVFSTSNSLAQRVQPITSLQKKTVKDTTAENHKDSLLKNRKSHRPRRSTMIFNSALKKRPK